MADTEGLFSRIYRRLFHEGFKGSYKKGALMLMGAGLAVRLLGFVNRVYMSNLIGAEGMGLVQLASPVYSLIILTLTSGVSITVSGMTAQAKARGNDADAMRVCKTAFAFLLGCGALSGVALALGADFISVQLLHDARTRLSLVMLAPCIPCVAAAAAIKGYYYGMARITPTAVSQIVEQIVRTGSIMLLASAIAGEDLAYACGLSLISAALGEMANLAVVGISFARECRKKKVYAPTIRRRAAATAIARASVPISVNRFITSIMGIVESVLLPMSLLRGGLDYSESIGTLGRISGMCVPLISFPTLVTSALATTLVPAISDATERGNMKLARSRISRCLRVSFLMGFMCFALFYAFGGVIGDIFYAGENVGGLLRSLSFCCILLYVQQTMSGILNGLGYQKFSLVSTLTGYAVRLAFIWFLVPVYGVHAYIWGELTGMCITVTASLLHIVRKNGMVFELGKWILSPAAPAVAFVLTGILMMNTRAADSLIGVGVAMAVSCFAAVLIYGIIGAGSHAMRGS